MVSFVCNACGNTVKKNQVEKHYQSQCRNCAVLSCIDCGIDFPGNSYTAHNSCVSEAEKYQGHLYQAKNKENKGENKQKEWIKQLQNATESVVDSKLKSLLQKVSEYSNVPQKEKKFQNFCKNSLRIYDESTLSQLWNAFSGSSMQKPKIVQEKENPEADDSNNSLDGNFNGTVQTEVEKYSKEKRKNKRKLDNDNIEVEQKKKKKRIHNNNENIEENSKLRKMKEENENKPKKEKRKQKQTLDEVTSDEEKTTKKSTVKFQWHRVIKQVLKESQNKELSVKKLRKKVLSAYLEHGCDHNATTIVECRSMFDKKLKTYPKVKIVKDNVKLIK